MRQSRLEQRLPSVVTSRSYSRPMDTMQLRALLSTELENIPRRGLAQNLYRMVYQQAHLNGFGAGAEIAPTSEAAHKFALARVLEHDPAFVPDLR